MILHARNALRQGDAATALGVLREAEQRFPSGALYEEREALLIEALLAAGQRALAIQRGQAFLARHAQSPHANRIRPLVETSAPE
jgi:outer membrane protein assembly factor BamD (BamD/ComL family)